MNIATTPPDDDRDDAAANSADAGSADRQSGRIPSFKVVECTKHLPEEQQKAIRWLHSHYFDTGKSLEDVGRDIHYDGGTVSKVFSGKYAGNLEDVCDAIRRFRELKSERSTIKKAPFIETSLYRDIEEVCQAALTYNKIGLLFGESQVGKTASLRHYAEKHNHGETYLVEMPTGGSLSHFLAALAAKLRMSASARGDILQLNLVRALGPNNLLIIDEAARAFQARSYKGSNLKTLDFIRELHDTSGCGLVLCGTNVFRDDMRNEGLKKFLNQFNRRCIARRQLPDVPGRADLNAFARHYGLDPANGYAYELQKRVVAEHGLGVWLTTLTAAHRAATKKRQPLTWEHVIKAHAFFRDMEATRKEEAA